MVAACLGQATQPADPVTWANVRFGKTGILYELPKEVKVTSAGTDSLRFSATYKKLTLTVDATPVPIDATLDAAAAYREAFAPFREQYRNKIRQIENSSEVIGAQLYGVNQSIGFVLDIVDGRNQIVVGWQAFQDSGWTYRVLLQAPAVQAQDLFRILGSVSFIDPASGEFKQGSVGRTGAHVQLYGAFERGKMLQTIQDEALYERTDSWGLQSTEFPIVAVLQRLDFKEAAANDPKAFLTRIGGLVKAIAPDGELVSTSEEVKVSDLPALRIRGEVKSARANFDVQAVVVTQDRTLWALLIFVPPGDKDAQRLASQVLQSLQIKPVATEDPDSPVGSASATSQPSA